MSTPGADDLGFELVPSDDADPTPDERVNAAALSALDDPDPNAPDEADDEDEEPLGYTWAFDWSAGRFVRQGISPAVVSGLDALRERCMMALNSARFAHGIFSTEFGFDGLNDDIGLLMTDETVTDFERRLRECLIVLDGVSDVQDVDIALDQIEGVILLRRFTVVNDEEVDLPFADIRLTTNGGA